MEQINMVERKKAGYPAKAIFSIACTLIFYILLYLVPVLGAGDRSSSIFYFLRYLDISQSKKMNLSAMLIT